MLLQILFIICTVVASLYGLFYAVIAVVGFFKKNKTNPHTPPTHRIAALIPARNEETVIGFLVESLMKQRYPKELYDVYVIVNNCTDNTQAAAERAGAKVVTCDREVHSKGEVLRYIFERLLAPDAPQYDGFCIFDADNLVDGDFLQAANNALSAGYMVAQGYRDSKNPSDNWVAGSTSVFYWFMSSLYNTSRANLGMSAALNGTGILLSADLIRAQGFDTTTLTEDLEYTAQSILNGYKIGWMRDAVIYDEQPTKLKDSFIQRRRWGAGSLQCSRKYLKQLLTMAWKQKNIDALDIGLLFMGMYAQAISCMPAVLTVIMCVLKILYNPIEGLLQTYMVASAALAGGLFAGAAYVFLMALIEKKFSKLGLSTYLLMGVYMLVWIPANLMSLVWRAPKWVSIQHVSAVNIEQCEDLDKQETPKRTQPKGTSV